ncbi:MAG: hypothetical protein WAZ98_05850 [Cyclobacteriaceae bacterium]
MREISALANLDKSNCYHQTDYFYTADALPKKIEIQAIDTSLSNGFSFEALNVVNAFGFLDLLKVYDMQKNKYLRNPTIENRLKLIELNSTITQKINIASIEISSVTSELDCEEKRADQISNFLKGKADDRERNLVIGSIVVGALGAIVTESLNNSSSGENAGSYVAVGTALAEATFGIMMLANNKKVSFSHERNTPGEIWLGPPTSKTLPPSIWYYLTYKDPDKGKESLREVMVKNWTTFGQIKNDNKKSNQSLQELYFGTGGKYSSEQLKNRADMYDQIGAYINVMKQDLKTLSIEFERFSLKANE